MYKSIGSENKICKILNIKFYDKSFNITYFVNYFSFSFLDGFTLRLRMLLNIGFSFWLQRSTSLSPDFFNCLSNWFQAFGSCAHLQKHKIQKIKLWALNIYWGCNIFWRPFDLEGLTRSGEKGGFEGTRNRLARAPSGTAGAAPASVRWSACAPRLSVARQSRKIQNFA